MPRDRDGSRKWLEFQNIVRNSWNVLQLTEDDKTLNYVKKIKLEDDGSDENVDIRSPEELILCRSSPRPRNLEHDRTGQDR
jgi:hypothetical protein